MDTDGVTRHLRAMEGLCTESELLRIAFPGQRIAGADPLALFRHHFLLFYHLYRLQDRFQAEGKHLHIHFMRTGLFPLPPAGQCRFFDPEELAFCAERTPQGTAYCLGHAGPIPDGALETLSLRHFYLDPANFNALDRHTIQAFLDGAWELLTGFDRYQESLEILGLTDTPTLDQVRQRFRQLAMRHHPDHETGSAEEFQAINRAYRFLLRVIPIRTP